MKKILLLTAFAVWNSFAFAQTHFFDNLDINEVKARVNATGDLFWNDTIQPTFTIPKDSSTNIIFAGAMWLGGLDNGGQLHLAAQTYRQNGSDFYPGPIMDSANYSAVTDARWDSVWKIDKTTIDSFLTWWPNHSIYPNYVIPHVILNWPGDGDTLLGEAAHLAPYVDVNGDGKYDPANNGDYPCIKGDQAIFFIFNDDRDAHGETGGKKLKIEVRAMLYAYHISGSPIDSAVFLNYIIVNRSQNNYQNMYIANWTDFDLGFYDDDYIGCDVARAAFYGYNGYVNDGPSALPVYGTYGANPPAEAVVFLHGPPAPSGDGIDNNHDGVTDEPGEWCTMNNFVYYNNDFTIMGNPVSDSDYYNYMHAHWLDSIPLTYGGNGYGGTTPCYYMFPGQSDQSLYWGTNGNPMQPWGEYDIPDVPGDRRGVASSGPFDFTSGQAISIDYAYVWGRTSSSGNLGSVVILQNNIDSVRNFYNHIVVNSCTGFPATVNELHVENSVQVFPNPVTDNLTVSWQTKSNGMRIDIYDLTGKIIYTEFVGGKTMSVVNTSSLASGIYLLRISDGEQTHTAKFLKR